MRTTGNWPLFPCSSSTSQTLLGSQGKKGRRVAGELAPAPGYTEEISLSLCLSACEPPPGPLPIPGLAPLFSLSLPAEPTPSALSLGPRLLPRGLAGLCPLPQTDFHTLPPAQPSRLPQFLPAAALLLWAEPFLRGCVYFCPRPFSWWD